MGRPVPPCRVHLRPMTDPRKSTSYETAGPAKRPYDATPPSRRDYRLARVVVTSVHLVLAGLYGLSLWKLIRVGFSPGTPSVGDVYAVVATCFMAVWYGGRFLFWLAWALTYDPAKDAQRKIVADIIDRDFR
jgi:hypothetical protein